MQHSLLRAIEFTTPELTVQVATPEDLITLSVPGPRQYYGTIRIVPVLLVCP